MKDESWVPLRAPPAMMFSQALVIFAPETSHTFDHIPVSQIGLDLFKDAGSCLKGSYARYESGEVAN